MIELWDHQERALAQLKNGSVLVGGTGSGKSFTALSYYLKVLGESKSSPRPLYIITTAKKRDDKDWKRDCAKLKILKVIVDSWNNIKKYVDVNNSFFIFDEQRLVGSGTWVKSFLKITKKNNWILLSATPADSWIDLIPVFIANGFFKSRTEFKREHVVYAPYVTFPKIIGYWNEEKLKRLRDKIFVIMFYEKKTTQHIKKIPVLYNKQMVKEALKTQWDPFKKSIVENLAQEVFLIRRIVNSHISRLIALDDIFQEVQKVIVFYNYNFELELIVNWFETKTKIKQWNGFYHDSLPEGESWLYLVQYKSGSEAWECFTTNHMVFYSLNYSYRTMTQARGRIDRHNTHYTDLYYYEFLSDSFIDVAIEEAINKKEDFNISKLKIPREFQLV